MAATLNMLPPRDDLPSAPGVEELGPLGSLIQLDGNLLRIPASAPWSPHTTALPVDDAAPLRDAARFVAQGLVLRGLHAQRELLNRLLREAFGPPRAIHSLGDGEDIVWFDGAIYLSLNENTFTVAFATPERLEALLSLPARAKEHLALAPARHAYEALAREPELGPSIGAMNHPTFVEALGQETFELYETQAGCAVRGKLNATFETRFQMKPGGVIGTPAHHIGRFPQASALGEWQPGLRNVDALSVLLAEGGASVAFTEVVLAADDLIGGFRGDRGIQLLAPWAACFQDPLAPRGVPVAKRARHWYNDAWLIGWVCSRELPEAHYVDEKGSVWAHWEDVPMEDGAIHRVGATVEGWFERQLYLLEHGYTHDAMCATKEELPCGLQLRDDLSDDVAKVYDDGDAVWLVDDRGIQRMSRHVATAAEVLAAAARAWARV